MRKEIGWQTLFFCSSLGLTIAAALLYGSFGQWTVAILSFLVLLFLMTVIVSNPHSIFHFYAFRCNPCRSHSRSTVRVMETEVEAKFLGSQWDFGDSNRATVLGGIEGIGHM